MQFADNLINKKIKANSSPYCCKTKTAEQIKKTLTD